MFFFLLFVWFSLAFSQTNSPSPKKLSTKNKSTTLVQHKKINTSHPIKSTNKPNIPAQNNAPPSSRYFSFVTSIKEGLVGFVDSTINTLRYSAYQLGGTRFDTSNGVYILDCSSYVDRILQNVYPQAYSNLVSNTGSDKPTTHDFYEFFNDLPNHSVHYWDRINQVNQLQAGDIIVFRYSNNIKKNRRGGHVMVVMDKPIANKTGSFDIRVTDSAPSGHSKDTRPSRTSGIGVGNLLLKVNPKTNQPYAYAWKEGARWRYNVNFAMGRPQFTLNTILKPKQIDAYF